MKTKKNYLDQDPRAEMLMVSSIAIVSLCILFALHYTVYYTSYNH